MSGRFFAAPLLLSLLALSRFELPDSGIRLLAPFALAAAFAVLPEKSPLRSDASYGAGVPAAAINSRGIADERGYYYGATGLLRAGRGKPMPDHPWLAQGQRLRATGARVERRGAIGFAGFGAGPGVKILDPYGLGDPMIARLHVDPRGERRIGHFERRLPEGYFETLESGANRIADPSLAEYYDALRRIVAGPLWSAERFALIAEMNTGALDHLVDSYHDALSVRPSVAYSEASAPKPQGTRWDAPGNRVIGEEGLEIELAAESRCAELELSVDHNDDYLLQFLRAGGAVAKLPVPRLQIPEEGLRVDRIAVPPEAAASGYDALAVTPVAGDGRYALGHLRLLCAE